MYGTCLYAVGDGVSSSLPPLLLVCWEVPSRYMQQLRLLMLSFPRGEIYREDGTANYTPLQSDWSLSCDHRLDSRVGVRTTTAAATASLCYETSPCNPKTAAPNCKPHDLFRVLLRSSVGCKGLSDQPRCTSSLIGQP